MEDMVNKGKYMSQEVKEITSCEVCENQKLTPVLNLGLHPLCDDLVPINNNRICHEYPIEILLCENCCTAHQRFQVPKRELFPSTYHYRARFTADVLNGMSNLVDSCENRFGSIRDKKVLDIGCNDGSLLNFFKAKGAVTFGIEPTGAASDAQKSHSVINDFLSESISTRFVKANGPPDIITFTNVFAHIENLKEVLQSLKILLNPKTVIIIENHYLGSVLDTNQFDTFYHEHPRTYSYKSFVYMAESLGLNLLDVEFPSRYGGNIRVTMGSSKIHGPTQNPASLQNITERESRIFKDFQRMSLMLNHWRESKHKEIQNLFKKTGKLRAKAFPGRAAILIKLLNLNESVISAVYEKPGSLKVGHYVPGTRIPIHSDEQFFSEDDKSKPFLNLAWHIPTEIRKYLSEHGQQGQVIDIVSNDDFMGANNQ